MGSGASLTSKDGEIQQFDFGKVSCFCAAFGKIFLARADCLIVYNPVDDSTEVFKAKLGETWGIAAATSGIAIVVKSGVLLFDLETKRFPQINLPDCITHVCAVDNKIYAGTHCDGKTPGIWEFDIDAGTQTFIRFENGSAKVSCMCSGDGWVVVAYHHKCLLCAFDASTGKNIVVRLADDIECGAQVAFTSMCYANGTFFLAPGTASCMCWWEIGSANVRYVDISCVGLKGVGDDKAKFSAICHADGKVFLAPDIASKMFVYDLNTQEGRAVDVSSAGLQPGKKKFSGICTSGGKIYLAPCRARRVFVYDPAIDGGIPVELPDSIFSGDGRDIELFKGVCSLGGEVFLLPAQTSRFLKCSDHRAFSSAGSAQAIIDQYEAEKARAEQIWKSIF